jgi:hypothetical protein
MPLQTPPDRLHSILQRTPKDVFEPDYGSDVPLVQFAAFGRDHRLFGWVRLRADRLTDLLNTREELLLTHVEIESREDGAMRAVDEVLIRCSELIAVHARGPRGDGQRRQRTRAHAIAIQSGNYLIGGYLHAPPGSDPIANMGERPLMVPLTHAWIEYWSGRDRTTQSIGTIIVNREQVDWIRVVTDEDLFGGLLRPAPIPNRATF